MTPISVDPFIKGARELSSLDSSACCCCCCSGLLLSSCCVGAEIDYPIEQRPRGVRPVDNINISGVTERYNKSSLHFRLEIHK